MTTRQWCRGRVNRRAIQALALFAVLQLLLIPAPCSAVTPQLAPIAELATTALISGGFVDLGGLGGPQYGMESNLLSTMQDILANVFNMDSNTLLSLALGTANTFTQAISTGSGMNGIGGLPGQMRGPATAIGVVGPVRVPGLAGMAGPARVPGPGRMQSGRLSPPLLPPLPTTHQLAPWATSHDLALRVLADKWSSALVTAQFSPGLTGFLNLLGLGELQEALVKWVCILYPWQAVLLPSPVMQLRDAYCVKALPAAAVSKLLSGPPDILG